MSAKNDTIREQLGAHHALMVALLGEVRRLVAERETSEATDRWAMFLEALEQHFAVEEELLFPVLAEEPAGRALADEFLAEHTAMRDLALEAERALIEDEDEEATELLGRLAVRLEAHAEREDLELYAAVDARFERRQERAAIGRILTPLL